MSDLAMGMGEYYEHRIAELEAEVARLREAVAAAQDYFALYDSTRDEPDLLRLMDEAEARFNAALQNREHP